MNCLTITITTDMTETAYIALGSNLGMPAENIRLALAHIRLLADKDVTVSSLWESEAVDCPPGSGKFLNAVAIMETSLDAHELLAEFQKIEEKFGRSPVAKRKLKNESRSLDLDIISYGDFELNEVDLVLPHPRAAVRRFVLAPLAEISPDFCLPGMSETVSQLLEKAPALDILKSSSVL